MRCGKLDSAIELVRVVVHRLAEQSTATEAVGWIAVKTPVGRVQLRARVGSEHAKAQHARRDDNKAHCCDVANNDFDAARIAAANNLLVTHRRLRTNDRGQAFACKAA